MAGASSLSGHVAGAALKPCGSCVRTSEALTHGYDSPSRRQDKPQPRLCLLRLSEPTSCFVRSRRSGCRLFIFSREYTKSGEEGEGGGCGRPRLYPLIAQSVDLSLGIKPCPSSERRWPLKVPSNPNRSVPLQLERCRGASDGAGGCLVPSTPWSCSTCSHVPCRQKSVSIPRCSSLPARQSRGLGAAPQHVTVWWQSGADGRVGTGNMMRLLRLLVLRCSTTSLQLGSREGVNLSDLFFPLPFCFFSFLLMELGVRVATTPTAGFCQSRVRSVQVLFLRCRP